MEGNQYGPGYQPVNSQAPHEVGGGPDGYYATDRKAMEPSELPGSYAHGELDAARPPAELSS